MDHGSCELLTMFLANPRDMDPLSEPLFSEQRCNDYKELYVDAEFSLPQVLWTANM